MGEVAGKASFVSRGRGLLLQAYLPTVLNRQADSRRNREVVVEVERDLAGGGGAEGDAPDAAAVLAEARAEARAGHA